MTTKIILYQVKSYLHIHTCFLIVSFFQTFYVTFELYIFCYVLRIFWLGIAIRNNLQNRIVTFIKLYWLYWVLKIYMYLYILKIKTWLSITVSSLKLFDKIIPPAWKGKRNQWYVLELYFLKSITKNYLFNVKRVFRNNMVSKQKETW